jgi:hypothetical protein
MQLPTRQTKKVPLQQAAESVAEQIKIEIMQDFARGTRSRSGQRMTPSRIRSFSDLHDYVDANMYGEDHPSVRYTWELHEDAEEGTQEHELWVDLKNRSNGIVDQWLREGQHRHFAPTKERGLLYPKEIQKLAVYFHDSSWGNDITDSLEMHFGPNSPYMRVWVDDTIPEERDEWGGSGDRKRYSVWATQRKMRDLRDVDNAVDELHSSDATIPAYFETDSPKELLRWAQEQRRNGGRG